MTIAYRGARAALLCTLLTSVGTAHADDDVPALPIRDLPPFPDIEEPEEVSEAGVFGAILADEETVVGASKREQSAGTVASAVTVLTSDQLRRYGYRTLAEALRGVGGLYIVDDRMVERIGVRGVQVLGDANTRVLILIDSTPLNEPWSQFVDGSTALPVSLDDVARIEIIRGPVSSIYGTNAFLGVINIVTLEADKAPRGYGRVSADTFGELGGNAAFNAGTINRQLRGSIGFAKRFGESIDYPDLGPTDADGAHHVFGSLSATFNQFFFQARAYERERELPGAPYNAEFGNANNANRDRGLLAELGYTNELSKRLTFAARAYVNRYTFHSALALTGADFETDASSLWYGGEVRVLADVLKKPNLLTTTAGLAVELTNTSSTASTKPDAIDTNFNIAGVYVDAASAPNKWFGASVGARFDRNSEFESKLSPRAALFLHQEEDYGLKLLYAEGFRNPSIYEAYYDDDARFAPSLDDDDQTELSPETIRSFEVVLYGKKTIGSASVKVNVSLWEWRMKDLIRRETFNDPDEAGNPVRIHFINLGALVSRGAEVDATYRDVAGRVGYLNVTAAFTGRNCIDDGGDGFGNLLLDQEQGNCDPRINSPTMVAKAGASSQLIADLLHVSGEVSYISSRGTQFAPDETVPAYVGLNVATYLPDVKGFDLTVGARNLIGREHVPAQSEYNRDAPSVDVLEVPGPGREIFARVGRRF